MPLPTDVEDAAERLSRIYGDALHHVRTELASIADETRFASQQRRLRGLASTLETRLRQVDTQAKQWVDNDLPRVYERGLGDFITQTETAQIDFTMPSRPAVERLGADLTDDLLQATQHVTRDSKRAIRQAVRSASLAKVVEGKSLRDARGAVLRKLEGLGIGSVRYANGARMPLDAYAHMAVRTVTAHAYNGGMLDAGRANGVEFFEVFDGPSCFAPGSGFVAYGGLFGLVRAQYVGPIYTLRCAAVPDGLAIGPHHPTLTRRGWVEARLLREGDEIVYDRRLNGAVADAEFDLVDVPAVEDVFDALGQPTGHRSAQRDDLHGDGIFAQGEIEVVRPAGGLLLIGDAAIEHRGDLQLVGADQILRGEVRESEARAFIGGSFPTSGRVMSGDDLSGTLLRRSVLPLTSDRARRRAESLHAAVSLVEGHDLAAALTSEGDRGHFAFSRLDRITVESYAGPVFDATTVDGLFAANGVVLKNCGWRSHDDDDKAGGSIRTREDCDAHLVAHPHCRRSFGARPDLTGEEAAAKAEPNGDPLAPTKPWKVADDAVRGEVDASVADDVARQHNKWGSNLTEKQYKALRDYAGSGYGSINDALRKGQDLSSAPSPQFFKGDAKEFARTLDSAIDAAPQLAEPTLAWRGIEAPSGANAKEWARANFRQGDEIELPAYQSTSLSPGVAARRAEGSGSLVFEIEAQRGAYLNANAPVFGQRSLLPEEVGTIGLPGEFEFLLPRGGRYAVANVIEATFEEGLRTVVQLRQL